jgi:hypothetical protein
VSGIRVTEMGTRVGSHELRRDVCFSRKIRDLIWDLGWTRGNFPLWSRCKTIVKVFETLTRFCVAKNGVCIGVDASVALVITYMYTGYELAWGKTK